ncbi:uncharacterized protein RCH25_006549 [Pelodytes ibericus]
MYGIFIYEEEPTETLIVIRKTTSTVITVNNLQPCTKYIFGMTSYNWFYTAGEENRLLYETGKLDPPQDITLNYFSNQESALLTWTPSIGASLYLASAKSEQGHEVMCSTSSTSCEMQGFLCEQRYVVGITAESGSCNSYTSGNLTLDTAPCAPVNVTVIRDCQINTVSLYWNPIINTVKYTAIASAADGSKVECYNREPTCFFMNLRCGTEYEMSVFAFNGNVNGATSQGIWMRTAPCDPINVEATCNCQENIVNVMWNESAGAFSYVVSALGSSGFFYNCSSVNTSCQITGLRCGESLSITVNAYDSDCPSSPSEQKEVVTAPCAPQLVSAVTDCGTHSTRIQWQFSDGAIFYVAKATASNDIKYACESYDQNCLLIDLPCSETFTVSVAASNYKCESPVTETMEFKTVPCIPNNVETELNCDLNTILVKWSEDPGNQTFKATAQQTDGGYYNCTTQGNTCEINHLNCGELYSVTVEADNAPCIPTQVVAETMCANGSLALSWTKSVGLGVEMYVAEFYDELRIVPCSPINLSAHVTPNEVALSWMEMPGALNYTTEITRNDGEQHVCYTSNITCLMTDLMCGHKYNVSVTAIGQWCSSNTSSPHEFLTAPCMPQNVTTYLDCVTDIVTVSWDKSQGAKNYTTEAIGANGEHHICNTTSTSCDFIGLSCGQTYSVTVSAANEMSISEPSLPVDFRTVPCVPEQKQPQLNCMNNSALLSWHKTLGALSYISNITSPGEKELSCQTESTECIINGLTCGQIYNVTVTAIDTQCRSQSSNPTTITVPCQPQNVIVQMNCSINGAHISWDKAPGAFRYSAALIASGAEPLVCNSTELDCEFDLQCGQTYTVTVRASNDQCESEISFPVDLYTVPCVPHQVQAEVNCESSTTILSWATAPGAVNYTTVVTGPQGQHHYCTGSNTSCSFPQLPCGVEYEASVFAVGKTCSSEISSPVTFETVPCQATNISVNFQCGADTATLSWDAAFGGVMYKATISSQEAQNKTCNTTSYTDTSCVVSGLKCGQTYTVSVDTFSATCSKQAISPDSMHTGPCVTENVTSIVDCMDNSAVLSWSQTPGALNYTALVTGPDTEEHTCSTTSTSCDIMSLSCGHTYNVSITSFNAQCHGETSTITQLVTAPCAPEGVRAETDCAAGSVVLSWEQMFGAERYTAYLMGSDGLNWTCSNTQANCTITKLPCGHEYNGVVSAFGSQCSGPLSKTIRVMTAPCIPLNVNTSLDCSDNSAQISWTQSHGAVNYTAILNEPQGEMNYSCSSSASSCWMRMVPCGRMFSVVVTAQNEMCSSAPNDLMAIYTCPCVPKNLTIAYNCESDMVSLQWVASPGAVYYMGSIISSKMESYICNTTDTTCDISGMQCGESYNVTLTAFNTQLASVSLEQQTFYTAPCVPTSVRTELPCGTGFGSLLWDSALGANIYSAVVTGDNGWSEMCNSHNTTCTISGLDCGQTYSLEITALNTWCASVASPVKFYTGPCTPENVTAQIHCENNTATVTWSSRSGAGMYISRTTGVSGEEYSCNSTGTSCDVSGMQCGHTYTVTVTAVNDQCNSEPSVPTQLKTVPCVPQAVDMMPQCASDLATLSWGNTSGAQYYLGILRDNTGENLTCNTTERSCDIRAIECGQTYNATVTAFNDLCMSGVSSAIMFETAPCVPNLLSGSVACDTYSVTVLWDSSRGADTYSITGSTGQDERSCVTSATSCQFNNLLCDMDYDFTINSSSVSCNSTGNSSLHVKTIPCPPQILDAHATCVNNSGFVQWVKSPNARSYMVSANGFNDTLFCDTSDTYCELQNLECGQNYTVTVWAEDGTCRGPDSTTQVTLISSLGATMYSAVVTADYGWNTTCSSQNTTCEIMGLACGQTYSVELTSLNSQCTSMVSTGKFYTEPCTPQNVNALVLCGTNTTAISWDGSSGTLNYTATVRGPHGAEFTCSTPNLTCNIGKLICGQNYNVTVTAFGTQCQTESTSREFHSSPCTPESVTAQIHCENNTAKVTWSSSSGAGSYISTITGVNAEEYSCNSTGTSCDVSGLQCGHTYTVTVTAVNDQCNSEPSVPVQLKTGPCVPQTVDIMPQCAMDLASLSWGNTSGAQYYIGILREDSGNTLTCNTTEQSCDIRAIECGQTYTATVTAFNDLCMSGISSAIMFETAPCVPTQLNGLVACHTHSVTVSWDSARGADMYTVIGSSAQDESSCISANTTCQFDNLLCDMEYNFTITSSSKSCNSTGNSSLHIRTIPCPPQILDAYATCVNNSGFIQWARSPNARSYIVSVKGFDDTLFCNTSDTYCELQNLECGQNYTVTVWGEDGACRGPGSTEVTFRSVPCVPQNVSSSVICETNALLLSWNASSGATTYTATATGGQNHMVTDNIADPSCLLPSLECGEIYSVTVIAMNDECKSAESPPLKVLSAPCSPLNLIATPQCPVIGASASWESSAGAKSYITAFTGPDGDGASCNTSDTSCSVSGLHCGQIYNVTVTAFDNNCHSLTTNSIQMSAAPCVPTNAKAEVDCAGNQINVTWTPSSGAESYTVTATGHNGHTLYCNTTTNECNIMNVLCGDSYAINITAYNEDCSSHVLTVGVFDTVPCIPDQIVVDVDCVTNEALVSWQDTNLSQVNYTAVARDLSGNELSCSALNFTCLITGLECGQEYTFTIIAMNQQCNSLQSAIYKTMTGWIWPTQIHLVWQSLTLSGHFFNTAPCQPEAPMETVDCVNNTASLSWSESKGAFYYLVTLSGNGSTEYCNTTGTSCSFPALPCGQSYNAYVAAMDNRCKSIPSAMTLLHTAPCQAQSLKAELDCNSQRAFLSWSESNGAQLYDVTVQRFNESPFSYITSNTSLSHILSCGQTYGFTVTAIGGMCNSSRSLTYYQNSAPCNPTNTAMLMDCKNRSASLSWEGSRGAVSYLAMVHENQNLTYTCNTTETVCTVHDLNCGSIYSFSVLAADLTCNSTITSPILSGVVPCAPDQVETSIYHRVVKPQEVRVSWNGSHCGADYMVTVQGEIANNPNSSFTLHSYWTSYMEFYIPVPCSSSYNVTVTARNPAGVSLPSDPVKGYTAPCAPLVNSLVVSDGNMLLSWLVSTNSVEYRVIDVADNTTVCRTSALSCETPFTNSTLQLIAANGAGQSEPTILPTAA